ncbi:MAG: Crp/Fnr family transcriptional regulator [Gammaproteobacteria bacterium]|nr:Crp/Fnr family transcriptional regulator [Gammaproteobacteria bacterium]MDH5593547.1 Crp/Fnr family transcriptional regulator [Gammaproteobacteria bacterium]MDH5613660.1 Crp/Fnr family transcriptional regulator [Gammaproteobacteria bacterium]
MSSREENFLNTLKQLSQSDQNTLMAFAEFLLIRSGQIQIQIDEQETSITRAVPSPEDIPRPEKESVVIAIKRLSATYPMISKQTMLNKISPLMSQHIMEGRDANEVIDDLEEIFRKRYEEIVAGD